MPPAPSLPLPHSDPPLCQAYNRINVLRTLLGPLRVEVHPGKHPIRFPVAAGRRAQRLCRRTLNMLTCFALTMDNHHTVSGEGVCHPRHSTSLFNL